jgi:TRAP-type C4-dicarboxylate transport system permease small subunit
MSRNIPSASSETNKAVDMDKLERFMKKLSLWFNGFALIALTAMLIVITMDIIGAKVFSRPVPGAMDVTSLLAVLLIGFSMTQTFVMGRHIKVDFVTRRLPRGLSRVLRSISSALCLLFFLIVVWRLFLYAHDLQSYGEKTLTVKISLFPFAYALAVAFTPMLLAVLIQLYNNWKGSDK